jgi:hypothetical protein
MKIKLHEIKIRDVVEGYENNDEEGVIGYGRKLNIRPAYQREFIYKDDKRNEVIRTIRNDFPLNVMYWAKSGEDSYEMLDGQQRTISFCEYIKGTFSIDYQYFHNLTKDEQDQILDYKLTIYICEGTDSEKLSWFKVINIAGEKLADQELRNAIYAGEWLTSAKKYFSKTGCPAYNIASDYMVGTPIRQDYLEKVIKWISNNNIEDYMSKHQHVPNANELWLYFASVIEWVKTTFPVYRREMKGIDWGFLYNEFRTKSLDPKKLEEEIQVLMEDEDVTNRKGIYLYVLNRNEKHLNIRAFSEKIKRIAYERQKGICMICKNHFEYEEMDGDHITPWIQGGKTIQENCQMLCKSCNRTKSGK